MHHPSWNCWAAALLTTLAGCGGGRHPPVDNSQAAICLDCSAPVQILDLPQLENALVTSDGRLFLSGQSNLYEVIRSGDDYTGQPLLPDGSGCSGLAEHDDYLYALCSETGGASGLYALALDDPQARPQPIFSLTGMTLPNGMAAAEDALYLTDGPIAAEPKIVRLSLDPADPLTILGQETWLLTLPDYPNGLVLHDGALYTTLYQPGGGGSVSRIDILEDGTPGAPVALATRDIMDDLELIGGTLIVTDWQYSGLFQISLDGELLQETAPFTFAQPSSVALAGPPLFDEPALLITERYTGSGLWRLGP